MLIYIAYNGKPLKVMVVNHFNIYPSIKFKKANTATSNKNLYLT